MTSLDNKKTKQWHHEPIIVFIFAVAAALLIKVPALFGIQFDQNESFYMRNLSLFVLPVLTGYFVWKRELESRALIWLSIAFIVAALFANVYPFNQGGDTEVLLALHLPIALWLLVGIAFSGNRWESHDIRMNFVRFSGELFIYYVLIALGGGVLTAFMGLLFGTIEIDIKPLFESWILPCGASGAVIIASWLAESKKNITGNIAPVLARLFTPLFTIILITFLGAIIWTGRGVDIDRNVLIAFNMLLLLVLGLLLYSISARDPQPPADLFDIIQIVLVISTLLADGLALWAISERITEWGFTPNRLAALGMNAILLVNLGWSTVLYIRFLRGRSPFKTLEQWQMKYLLVYAIWGAVVATIFPPLFGFM